MGRPGRGLGRDRSPDGCSLLVPLQTIRLIHHLIMWLIVAFLIHHVYSAMLLDRVEASGVNSSIFSGFKFLPKDRL